MNTRWYSTPFHCSWASLACLRPITCYGTVASVIISGSTLHTLPVEGRSKSGKICILHVCANQMFKKFQSRTVYLGYYLLSLYKQHMYFSSHGFTHNLNYVLSEDFWLPTIRKNSTWFLLSYWFPNVFNGKKGGYITKGDEFRKGHVWCTGLELIMSPSLCYRNRLENKQI